MRILRLCTQCDIGCFSKEDADKHEKETGHKMDDGRKVKPMGGIKHGKSADRTEHSSTNH